MSNIMKHKLFYKATIIKAKRREVCSFISENGTLTVTLHSTFLFYVHYCFASIYVCLRMPDLGLSGSRVVPCGCRELNPDSLKEHFNALNCLAISPAPSMAFQWAKMNNSRAKIHAVAVALYTSNSVQRIEIVLHTCLWTHIHIMK